VKIGKDSKGFIIPKQLLNMYDYKDDVAYSLEVSDKEIIIRKTDVKVSKVVKVKVVAKDKEFTLRV
jgi:antitoxin component of MazEF toxin-antitoxin module